MCASQLSSGVSIVACVRDERPYLIEWIAYHSVLGFASIICYDNRSRDRTTSLLRRLHARGLVEHRTIDDHPAPGTQVAAFGDAVARCETEWLMQLDVDEFVVLHDHDSIHHFLAGLGADVSQVCINWRVFGSSGRSRSGFGPVVRRFQRASPPDFEKNRHVKSIVRAKLVESSHPHSFTVKRGRTVHDDGTDAELTGHALSDKISHARASINHYILKSRREYRAKAARGAISPRGEPGRFAKYSKDFWCFYDRNETPNSDALRNYTRLKREMRRLHYVALSGLWR
jgi:hypothetical protein